MDIVIPQNTRGKAVDLEHPVTAKSSGEARELFRIACERLLQPGTWHDLSGRLTATFTLKDNQKNTLERPAAVNDFIQVDIPSPGHDWVQVKSIDKKADPEADESFAMTIQVSPEPGKGTEAVDHFFGEGASSTFIIKRKGKEVSASYHGRNEKPNTDKLRNTLVALGAIAGLSELQWTALLKGLLEK